MKSREAKLPGWRNESHSKLCLMRETEETVYMNVIAFRTQGKVENSKKQPE
jgi:hypothetical protein